MKKVFLFFIALFLTANVMATSVYKKVSDLKTTYGWSDGNSYTNFALDDVITLGSVSGSAKYSNSATSLRYFQWTEKGYGSLIFKAKAGYVITSIKLKYTQAKAGTVPCVYWWQKNFRVPACDVLSSNVARNFNSNQVVIFLGNTDTSTDNGEIQVSEYTVTYEQVAVDRKYTKAMTDLVMQYNWESGKTPLDALTDYTVQLNNVLSLKEEKTGNLRYWENNRALTCYQNSGSITFKAREGATIKNMRVIYYASSATDAVGVLVRASDWGTDGKSIPAAKQIASNAVIPVNSNSISLKAGNIYSGSAQTSIMITGVQIEYTDGNSQMETYANLTDVSSSSEKKYTGDNGYKWKVKNFAHRDTSAMYDHLGIHLFYNGYIATDGVIEGGIKDVSFEWRLASSGSRPISEPTKFTVTAGSKTETCTDAGGSYRMAGHHMTYNHAFEVKSNAAFSINVGAKESTAQAQPIFGPVTITPYLLYTKKAVTIKAKDYASQNFKYTNSALINNTAGEGTISYAVSGENANKIASINSSTGEVTIKGEGTVTVTASWEGVTTTYSLTIQLETPSISFAESEVTKMVSAGSYKQTLTFTTPSSGTGIYSIVSGPASGTIDDDGTVHFTEAGDYVIKGKFNTLPYKPDSTTYTLTVTELVVPTLSFAADNVEKPVGASAFTNAFSKPDDDEGAVTYASNATGVATVDENSGEVSIVAAGTATITASVAETSKYAAGNKSYSLKVFPLSDISFADKEKNVYLNADPFIYAVTKTAGDGAITYKSSNTNIADVDDNGLVTLTGTAFGLDTITAIIAKTENYWADTAHYTLNVSSLKLPTASFGTEIVVNKVQGFASFTKGVSTESDGVKHYFSSDTRVATVNETTGEVTKGEKPGTTIISVSLDASATWEALDNAAQYTLNVSSAPIEDMHPVSKTVADIKQSNWENGKEYSNVPINDVLTLSKCKYYTGQGGESRYYYNADPKYVSSTTFTIQAKAGVIIKSVKFTYNQGNANMILADGNYGDNVVAEAHRIISGETYKVDANAVTYYVGRIGATSTDNHINISKFEITYFDPSQGVAVTKMVNDLGKSEGLDNDHSYKNIAVNQAISLCTNDDGNLKYYTSGVLNCYRHKGAIEIKVRPGATIHHVKITYTATEGCLLTKYKGTGFSILPVDQIASDSILYVNANSIKLDVGTSQASVTGWPSISITKIYVNYTDNSEVVVDNFNNCDQTSGDSVVVAGVDGKYDWTIKKFNRDNAQRMYYDQSIKLSQNGTIYTEYTGGLKEAAFDWHPTESGKDVSFTVNAGDSSWTVSKTAAVMDKVYTFNFQKLSNKTNGEFSITVNGTTPIEIGHVSLTPYILYTCKDTTIAAKDYKDAEWKFTNNTLINYTGKTVEYSTSDATIASIDSGTGEVTIQTGGTVTISATADGVTTSYSLTINLEETSAEFATKAPVLLLSAGSYKQKLNITTEATEGNVVNYTFVGDHEGATLLDSTVTFTQTGTFTIKGRLEQNLPYAAAEDEYVLTVNNAPSPDIYFAVDSLAKDIHDTAFINPLTAPEGVGAATYSSSNTDVATVENNGTVTIVGSGKTTIKVVVAESASYAADSASYILNVLPLPEMSFEKDSIIAYINTLPFTYTVTVEEGEGVPTYTSSNPLIAQVKPTSGEVNINKDGEVTITAHLAKSDNYSAGSASYTLIVNEKMKPEPKFAQSKVVKQQSDTAFTNALDKDDSDGDVSYISSDESVAKVNAQGLVTLQGKPGKITITANITATATYVAASTSFELTVKSDPTPGGETVNGNIAKIAQDGGWNDGDIRSYFKLNNVISVSDSNRLHLNSQYLSSDKSVRFYQNKTKGQFFIRAKAGVIIQAVKFTYTSTKNGVITSSYENEGKSVLENKRYISGTTYKFDANKLVFYTGSTSTNTDGDVHITNIEVKYFDPQMGVAETKNVKDLAYQFHWKGKEYSPITFKLNNVITMSAVDGTMKYSEETNQLHCYQWLDPVTISAREGALIHYVKVSYGSINNGVLSRYGATSSMKIEEQIASDSVLYVNAQSIQLYTGSKESNTNGQTRITKIYVVYTDSTASVDNFDNCTKLYGGDTPTEVEGVDGVYNWKITEFNRDSLRRIGYDQSIMLRQDGGKIETVGTEGGVKEVSFDWFASNSGQGVKFNVKVGDETISTVDSAATGGWYPVTCTKTGIKHNGAFSIEVDAASGSQLEFGHISLTPYLLYTTKEADVELGNTYQMAPQIDNRDNETAITYTIESGEGEITPDGTVTPSYPGDMTIQAAWDGITTTYTLHVSGTLTLNEAENNAAKIAANDGKQTDVKLIRTLAAGKYNTFCVPFTIEKDDLASVVGTITSLATLDETSTASLDDQHKNLDIVIKEVETIEAGKPYLLWLESAVENPTFSNVTIDKSSTPIASSDDKVTFYGITSPYSVSATSHSILFVKDNKLAWNNTGKESAMNGMRAYFYVPGMDASAGVAPRLVFRQPSTPTGIDNHNDNDNHNRKMIINNQLVIIRNGVRYNANGQLLKMVK